MGAYHQTIYDAILEGEEEVVSEQVNHALQGGAAAADLLNQTLIPAMAEVGDLFEQGEYFVPEMLIAARAMKAGLNILKPLLIDAKNESLGRIAIGTVKGDLHDIGKNLVAIMLEGAGFEVVDLGVDVPSESFLEVVEKEKVDMVAMSALLTTTMVNMEKTINMLQENGVRDGVKVLVGGAPVTQEYADTIGADGFAADANQAARTARQLLTK